MTNKLSQWKSLNRRIENCQQCSRLRAYCKQVAQEKRAMYRDETYWGRPVPNFGDPQTNLLIIGLAPAAHGANRTGRMFTGDRSGEWLYRALFKAGFANRPTLRADDDLKLIDCAITAVCHCAPPDNRPSPKELQACQPWLAESIDLARPRVLLALGQIAWKAVLQEAKHRKWHEGSLAKFAHGQVVCLSNHRWLIGSYHPSQQTTFTGRLTEPMFDAVFRQVKQLLHSSKSEKRNAGR